MIKELRKNCEETGVTFLMLDRKAGYRSCRITRARTYSAGHDHCMRRFSHITGAFGAIAFGVGTSQVRDLLRHKPLHSHLLK